MRATSIAIESVDLLYERAFEAHWDDVFRFSLAWTNDWAAAEDMAQTPTCGSGDHVIGSTGSEPSCRGFWSRLAEPGILGQISQVGNECWVVVYTGSGCLTGHDYPNFPTYYHFVRIGPSGIDFDSPILPTGTRAVIFDGTFWILTDDTADPSQQAPIGSSPLTTMQRIDPATWQPTGPIWTYTGSAPVFAAGGSLWAANTPSDGAYPTAVDRLDVPMGAIGS